VPMLMVPRQVPLKVRGVPLVAVIVQPDPLVNRIPGAALARLTGLVATCASVANVTLWSMLIAKLARSRAMARKPNNGPTFSKKAATKPRVQYAKKRAPVSGSTSRKTGNLKRWSRW